MCVWDVVESFKTMSVITIMWDYIIEMKWSEYYNWEKLINFKLWENLMMIYFVFKLLIL